MILPKESLNSDGHQFHQYQQKELNTKIPTTYDVGNPYPGLGQAQKYGGVKPFNGIPTLPLDLQTQYIEYVFQ